MKKILTLTTIFLIAIPLISQGSVLGFATKSDIAAISKQLTQLSTAISNLIKLLTPQRQFGASGVVQAQAFSLSGSGITTSATSIVLTSFKLPDASTTITMSNFSEGIGYLTLEPGTAREEQISFTGVTQNGDGTATLTGVTRGVNFVLPCNSVTSLQKSHAGGTKAVLSNTACFYSHFVAQNSTTTIGAVWTYNNAFAPRYDSAPNFTGSSSNLFANLAYVNSVASSGAPNASTILQGLVQLGTATNTIVGTSVGSTGAFLIALNSLHNTTSSATTTIPVTQPNVSGGLYGLSSGFIDQTATYNWTGSTTLASTTVNGTLTLSTTTVTSLTVNGGAISSTTINQLGLSVLATPQTSITVGGLPFRKNYRARIYIASTSVSGVAGIQLNGDSGGNYGYNSGANGAAFGSAVNQTYVGLNGAGTVGQFMTVDFSNVTSSPKMFSFNSTMASSTYPTVNMGSGVWYNTTNAINSISVIVATGGGTFASSSYLEVDASPN